MSAVSWELTLDDGEPGYAMLKRAGSITWNGVTHPRYEVRVKYPARDNGYGLHWPSVVYTTLHGPRQEVAAAVTNLGFTVVSSWAKARADWKALQARQEAR